MSAVKPYDWAAAAVAVLLVVGTLGLAAVGRECPVHLRDALLLALGWLFRGGVGTANDFLHRERSAPIE